MACSFEIMADECSKLARLTAHGESFQNDSCKGRGRRWLLPCTSIGTSTSLTAQDLLFWGVWVQQRPQIARFWNPKTSFWRYFFFRAPFLLWVKPRGTLDVEGWPPELEEMGVCKGDKQIWLLQAARIGGFVPIIICDVKRPTLELCCGWA